jgi:hypothetical protein
VHAGKGAAGRQLPLGTRGAVIIQPRNPEGRENGGSESEVAAENAAVGCGADPGKHHPPTRRLIAS